ncbi:MAG: DoxX family protein [Phycisphaerae bacterium]|nr:DoxX family protein [Phycisphaerae bacterium]
MSFSHAAAAHVVPLLSRLAIAAVMIPLGWTDLTTTSTFTGDDAGLIDRLELAEPSASVAGRKVAWLRQAPESTEGAGTNSETSSSASSEPPAATSEEPTAPSAEVSPSAAESTSPTASEVEPAASEGTVTARHLHRWTVLFAEAGVPGPVPLAWTTALLEVIGGSLLVLGLVTRVWGVLCATLFASLIWILGVPYTAPNYLFGADVAAFESVAAGLGMLVLSLGLALTGGGFLSLDRAIFRPRPTPAQTPVKPVPASVAAGARSTAALPSNATPSASAPSSGPLTIAGSTPSAGSSGTRSN